jgi:type IV secretory pathway VirB2 component (pilin)
MTTQHTTAPDPDSNRFRRLRRRLLAKPVVTTTLLSLAAFVTPAAAQSSGPTGGSGGSVDGWETILNNLYDVVYTTLQYAGLTVLVLGFIVWLTARSNSQRSETGMKLTMGGGAMVIAYFGLGALVSLLEFIAG